MENIKPQMQAKMDTVNAIRLKLDSAKAFYITKYDGIDVESLTALRRNLRNSESELKVYKNTLVRIALKDEKYASNFNSLLTGPNAIAFSYNDSSATAKVLFDFAKANKSFEIKGCLFDNEFFGPDKISIIKDLPSREALLSMLASVINEPMAKLARTLDALRETKEA